MIIVLAALIVTNEALRTWLQDAFAVLTVILVENIETILVTTAVLAIFCVYLWITDLFGGKSASRVSKVDTMASLKTLRAGEDAPRPHWQVLTVLNYVAVVIFATSSTFCFLNYRTRAEREASILEGETGINRNLLVALISASLSLAYLLGFFGISFVSGELFGRKMPTGLRTGHYAEISGVEHPDADVVIVGAGITGASLAVVLAKQGKRVTLVERSFEIPERIVGELMQPGGMRALEKLGLKQCATNAGAQSVECTGYVVISKDSDELIQLQYPDKYPETLWEHYGYGIPLPKQERQDGDEPADDKPRGRGFHNHLFLKEIREEVKKQPNIDFIEGTVTALLHASSGRPNQTGDDDDKGRVIGISYKTGNQEIGVTNHSVYAPLTVVADGLWSGLRNKVSESSPEVISHFVGLILNHPAGKPPVLAPGRGHVVLARPNPVLLYQISPTETRVLVDVPKLPRAATGEMKEYMLTKILPQLPEVSQPAFLEAVHTENFKSMPNRTMAAEPFKVQGAVMMGDAWNMRHPLTGGGMTVALNDVALFAELVKAVDVYRCNDLDGLVQAFVLARRNHASMINILADALHSVFTSPEDNETRETLRRGCFEYLKEGGHQAAGPLGLLAGISPLPNLLAVHFFMVALKAIRLTLSPFPTPRKLAVAWNILHVACVIIMPLIERERVTPLSWKVCTSTINLIFPYRGRDIRDM